MTEPTPTEIAEAKHERRKRRQQRQAVIFGALIIALALLLGGGIAIFSGLIDSPIKAEFTPEKTPYKEPIPCPVGNGQALAPGYVTVTVFNSTTRTGLAKEVSSELKTRKFKVTDPQNLKDDEEMVMATVLVRFGPEGINQAYTVAGNFPSPDFEYVPTKEGVGVDVILGVAYEEPLPPVEVVTSTGTTLKGVSDCKPHAETADDTQATP